MERDKEREYTGRTRKTGGEEMRKILMGFMVLGLLV